MSESQATSASRYEDSKTNRLAILVFPNHRQLACQFFVLGMLALVFIPAFIWTDHNQSSPLTLLEQWGAHTPLIVLFGIVPLILGALGNLIVPLQSGAGDRFGITIARVAFWTFTISWIACLVDLQLNDWVPWLEIAAGAGWSLSVILLSIRLFVATQVSRYPQMTPTRLPVTAWVLSQLAIPMLLVTIQCKIGIPLIFGNASRTAVPDTLVTDFVLWFHLGESSSFWSIATAGIGGILVFAAFAFTMEILAVLGRRQPAVFVAFKTACVVGGYSVFGYVITKYLTSDSATLFGLNPMWLPVAASVICCTAMMMTMFPWRGRVHPAFYFAAALPVVFALSLVWNITNGQGIASGSSLWYLPLIFGTSAATYFWFPRLWRFNLNQSVARLHFWLTLVATLIVIIGSSISTTSETSISTMGWYMLVAAQFPFVINSLASTFKLGNRVFLYPAILGVVEFICIKIFGLDHGVIGWMWSSAIANPLVQLAASLILLAIMAGIDIGLMRAFPPKRQHPRPNRFVAILVLMTTFPLFLGPVLLTDAVVGLSPLWAWGFVIASSVLGIFTAFRRGNRLTFWDEVVDNPWKANSLEWYEREGEAMEAYPSNLNITRGPYEYESAADDSADAIHEYAPQWQSN